MCVAMTLPAAAGTAAAAVRAQSSPRAAALAALRGLQSRPPTHTTRPARGNATTTDEGSYNWSGYVDLPAGKKTVTSAVGSWIEPKVKCAGDENEEAVFWVGFDGWTNDTVEQAGTVAQCYLGSAFYYTWWEMYPTNDITVVGDTVAPGDHITASIAFNTGTSQYTLAVTDSTNSANSFSVAETCGSGITCANASADWIGETPGNVRGYYPLPDFKTWTVTAAKASVGTGTAEPISHLANDNVTLVGDAGYALATPGALYKSGTGFVDHWDNSY
jgi:hypothetical protein